MSAGARVLVVDDEPAILRAVQPNLARHDFRVETADTGLGALEAHNRFRPDVLLLDLGLPDMDGLDVIREIRARVCGWQVSTALLLVLAANTAFADFPRLASILARDRFALRIFQFRGDRLAFTGASFCLLLSPAC